MQSLLMVSPSDMAHTSDGTTRSILGPRRGLLGLVAIDRGRKGVARLSPRSCQAQGEEKVNRGLHFLISESQRIGKPESTREYIPLRVARRIGLEYAQRRLRIHLEKRTIE
jgi:hypothetical protein